MKNGRVGAAVLVVLLALGGAGCSAGSSNKAASAAGRADVAVPQQKGAAPSGQPLPTLAPRAIVYSGQLSLLAKDVAKVVQQATELATASGGYVERESNDSYQDGPSAQLVLKVPAAQYQSSLDQLAALGSQVLSRNSQAQDVTQQVVDVNSRLKSQQASVDRVRALMAQAQSITDVVSLESELSRREADLESLQSQQQALSTQAALSTIAVSVQSDHPATGAATKKPDSFGSSLGHALGGGWHVLVTILRWMLIALAAALPFVLLLAPIGWYVLRARRPKPAAMPGEEQD